MKAVVCRVDRATVSVNGSVVGEIGAGLLVYLGVMAEDDQSDVIWMARKLPLIRVFGDEDGKMNRSVQDVDGGLLLIPNFTLSGRTRKGTRPSYSDAAPPETACRLFDQVVQRCAREVSTASGVFGAHMSIDSAANGPVTVLLDSREVK